MTPDFGMPVLDLRTPIEWCREYGIRILAWDGWRAPDPLDVNAPLGLSEFHRRVSKSTTEHKLDAYERIAADLAARRAARKPQMLAAFNRTRQHADALRAARQMNAD